jgi:hypothetical protein
LIPNFNFKLFKSSSSPYRTEKDQNIPKVLRNKKCSLVAIMFTKGFLSVVGWLAWMICALQKKNKNDVLSSLLVDICFGLVGWLVVLVYVVAEVNTEPRKRRESKEGAE